ncbi:hypothetical protein K437DRAFT_274830 [Tilletiaria anomala UBC 951]|uniref:Nucleolar protein 12 n=1 Tax=Tilletiaria anomala (strain ATCC 24038 / CBS 436.72 / UBC 951) TaxID=1037660 RepID=A0A066VQA6_TILAU|nr:uncharacterized protein K437DRAFT_274830 [Tilletiaria anomala UBC 951]KDN43666.1 hypothetical protein K437DRAFT_274830 [Tilletiaria anomala UBC 951]
MGKKRAAQTAAAQPSGLANGRADVDAGHKAKKAKKDDQTQATGQNEGVLATSQAASKKEKNTKKGKRHESSEKGKRKDKAKDGSSGDSGIGAPFLAAAKENSTFDSELDSIFSTAAKAPRPIAPVPSPAPTHPSVAESDGQKAAAREGAAGDGKRGSEEEEDGDDADEDEEDEKDLDGEQSESSMINGLAEEDEDAELEALNEALENLDDGDDDSVEDNSDESDSEEGEEGVQKEATSIDNLVQAGLSEEKQKAKATGNTKEKKQLTKQEQEEQNRRTIFIGNLPIEVVKSRPHQKSLKRHMASCLVGLDVAAISSLRFRSIPFSVPTGDYTSSAASAAEAAALERKNERSLAHRQAVAALAAEDRGLNPDSVQFLRPSQKRKVAFIKQDLNTNATSVNAYMTLAVDVGKSPKEDAATSEKAISPARILAAALAASADGTLFLDRHLRTDLAVRLAGEETANAVGIVRQAQKEEDNNANILAANAPKIMDLLTGSGLGDADPKRTVFVGNLDFTAKEEDLRAFFEGLVTGERGPCPPSSDMSTPTWVRSVRIVRDRATQLGKGFAYVRFIDDACVDEVMAIHEAEQAFLAQSSPTRSGARGAGNQQHQKSAPRKAVEDASGNKVDFKRKLKFMKRPIRVSRCKATTKSATASARKAVSFGARTNSGAGSSPRYNGQSSPAIRDTPGVRRRSTGAPTPGGTSPYMVGSRDNKHGATAANRLTGSPVSKRSQRFSTDGAASRNSGVQAAPTGGAADKTSAEYRLLDKETRSALKKADAERQARRLEKKQRKAIANKMLDADANASGKVKLKQGKAAKKGRPGAGTGGKRKKEEKGKKKSSASGR